MSTKKNKFNQKDHYYMNLAFNLARDQSGLTGPNPPVGCVIVKNDEVISEPPLDYSGAPSGLFDDKKQSVTNSEANS